MKHGAEDTALRVLAAENLPTLLNPPLTRSGSREPLGITHSSTATTVRRTVKLERRREIEPLGNKWPRATLKRKVDDDSPVDFIGTSKHSGHRSKARRESINSTCDTSPAAKRALIKTDPQDKAKKHMYKIGYDSDDDGIPLARGAYTSRSLEPCGTIPQSIEQDDYDAEFETESEIETRLKRNK